MTLMVIDAPLIAKKAQAGEFIILRVNEHGERIPLTVADYDREKGTVTIIYQIVGKTTMLLDQLNEGDALLDFIGPLGKASNLTGFKKAAVIGGRRWLRHRISAGESAARAGHEGRHDCRFPQPGHRDSGR